MARSYMIQALPNEFYNNIDSYYSARDMMNEVTRQMQGSNIGARIKVTNCMAAYETFRQKEGEMLEQTFDRFCGILNETRKNGLIKTHLEKNFRFLKNLSPEWKPFVSNIIQNKPVETMDIHEIFELLIQNEEDLRENRSMSKPTERPTSDPLALMTKQQSSKRISTGKSIAESKIENKNDEEDFESDEEIKDLVALLSNAINRKRFARRSNNNNQRYTSSFNRPRETHMQNETKKPEGTTMNETIICYKCLGKGHFARDCKAKVVRDSEYYSKKMELVQQRQVGVPHKAFMAEDAHWLDES